ncbi:monosaccharide ABC transporter membrane protein, CUT2 family [Onishia taeanensis]|jgi:ribose transport system permease protein|uniref:Monosaccharide ABC transporter membrane protein, CUT2 family n=2 Tax=Onishia taeanensis TaxID=284577 RepID=A0A1G7Q6Q3_9GAMM|nr:monosaccharide ABC transporter membrane protein, CUT2 family [Halomonas taeanensis]
MASAEHTKQGFMLSKKHKAGLLNFLSAQGILVFFLICMFAFSLTSEQFLSQSNIMTVVRQASIIGIIAVGVTVVIIGGNLDLSVGSMLSFSTVLVVDLHDKIGPVGAILVMFALTLMLGALNGLLVGFMRLNSLIVTLAMLSAIQGLVLIYSGGQNVDIANQSDTWFGVFGQGYLLGIAVPIIIFSLLAIIVQVVMSFTGYGRRIFAIGGNPVAAVYSGIRKNWCVFSTYMISAFCVACAALVLGARVMGSQNNVGQGYELLVLAGIILGGTSLLGGAGSIWKTVIGVLILGFIQNGLLLMGYPYYTQWLVTWVIIILAVWLDLANKRKRLLTRHS